VVTPWKFPGADIGTLAVCGTINDLVVQGARPRYLALALIVEEGLDLDILQRVIASISRAAEKSKVSVVTGDFKVVEKGACDKIFVTTSGIGDVVTKTDLSVERLIPGDRIILTGTVGEHGLAVLSSRKGLDTALGIASDAQALDGLLLPVARLGRGIKFMRDPTRGGLATTLNEIAESSGLGITVDEKKIPVTSRVRAACELFGIDPLYVANEGKAVIIVDKAVEGRVMALLRRHPDGRHAQVIGRVTGDLKRRVILRTSIGTERLLDMLVSDPLPRIC
jgi:hydrogenase expression/formation protein HypE